MEKTFLYLKEKDMGEKVVKSKIFTSEQWAIVSWEEFQMYCAYREQDAFSYIKRRYPYEYYSMQIADFILGNEDRHGQTGDFLWTMTQAVRGDCIL